MIKSETADIVCVRSWPEYIGEVSGYNYIEKKGRIPGAMMLIILSKLVSQNKSLKTQKKWNGIYQLQLSQVLG